MSTHDIVCVTYGPDAVWTKYMLRSIRKWSRGFRQVHVIYPEKDDALFREIAQDFPDTKLHAVVEPAANGHRHQMVLKCTADEFSDADFIHHIDSDCVLTGPFSPEDVFTDGRPDLIYTLYSSLQNVPWQGITENTLGFACPWETMRRFPFVYPRWLYPALRSHIEARHGLPFAPWVYNAPLIGGAWHGFSEFNALGAFALQRFADSFRVYDSLHGLKPVNVFQNWSHFSRGEEHRARWEEIHRDLERITEGWDKK